MDIFMPLEKVTNLMLLNKIDFPERVVIPTKRTKHQQHVFISIFWKKTPLAFTLELQQIN